jgi:hypothetical protein
MKKIACPTCACEFYLSDEQDDALRRSGANFYCPNGHSLSYDSTTKKEIEALKKERDHYKADAEKAWAAYRERGVQRNAMERSRNALRGVITKMRKARNR